MTAALHDKVVSITPEVIKEFEDKKIIQHNYECLNIDLPELEPGDQIIDYLNKEESTIFLELCNLYEDKNVWDREIIKRMLNNLADHVSNPSVNIEEAGEYTVEVLSKAESDEYYERVSRADYLAAFFWYSIKTRLKAFNQELIIKDKFSIVSLGNKYCG